MVGMQATGPLPMVTAQLPVINQQPAVRVCALGGGHGLSATLAALRIVAAEHLTGICTVADDGGSSGRLREDMDVLPPGDLRMALAALCDDTDWGRTWAQVMQHRLRSKTDVPGGLHDHAVGNLLIVALWELLGDPVDGLRWAGALLGARGQVLPMSRTPLRMSATVQPEDPHEPVMRISSQAEMAKAGLRGRLSDVEVLPNDAQACREALDAIELSDWIVFGPGSWYTSVLPHLLLNDLREALQETEAKRCVVMNLRVDTLETSGLTPAGHLRVLGEYAPDVRFDAVLTDPQTFPADHRPEFDAAAAALGATVYYKELRRHDQPEQHDPLRLATAMNEVFHAHQRYRN